jgi:hypothetical protein
MNRSLILTALLALVWVPAPSSAQSVATTARARILVGLSLTKNSDLNMGIYTPGAGTVTVAATSPNAGKFTATGTPSTGIRVTFPATITLTSGPRTLSLSTIVRGNANDNQAGSSAVASGATVTMSAAGRHYFWLGGSTTIGAAAGTGTYTGTFTLTIQY